MDVIRLFIRSNSSRSTNGETNLINQEIPDEKNNSTPNLLTIENEDNQSSSSEKIKSFFLTHPSSTTVHHQPPKFHFELETCSGSSTSEQPTDTNIAASAFQSISNARSFTNHSSPTRRHQSFFLENNELTRSWIAGQTIHHMLPSSPPFRRIKSYHYPARIRKRSLKKKHSNASLTRRYSQVKKRLITTYS